MSELDPLLLSRIQFAFTISFHILFPSFTIGLAAWLVVLEALWLKTGRAIYLDIAQHWTKIFAVSFGMGVVSGVVLSYEFGTNWSELSRRGGNVIGPLMSYEVLTAFFLEAGFLGIMLFGWKRVSKPVHFFASCMVAFGTLLSAFWILSANSWMQTPVGYTVAADGVLHVADWLQVIFNPSFPYRFAHMVAAAYLTTAFMVAGIGAWYILRERSVAHGRIMLGMGLSLLVWLAPLQLVIGDLHGLNTRQHQPAKIAALEAHWDTERGAPLILFAIPDPKAETNHFELAVPRLGSLILTHEWDGEIQGLKSFPP
jgi:cytochrome d ubiquinol oxidase subunit I